jgi:hypothetical protein
MFSADVERPSLCVEAEKWTSPRTLQLSWEAVAANLHSLPALIMLEIGDAAIL